jgi:hypothetical protein
MHAEIGPRLGSLLQYQVARTPESECVDPVVGGAGFGFGFGLGITIPIRGASGRCPEFEAPVAGGTRKPGSRISPVGARKPADRDPGSWMSVDVAAVPGRSLSRTAEKSCGASVCSELGARERTDHGTTTVASAAMSATHATTRRGRTQVGTLGSGGLR